MLKHYLNEAKNKLKEEAYEESLEASTKALDLDGMNFQALMLKGKSLFHLDKPKQAEVAYRRAVELQPDTPLAWKGLLEVFEQTGDHAKAIEPLEKLIGILTKNEKWDRCQKVSTDLAKTATSAGLYPKALDTWYPLVVEDSRSPLLYLEKYPNEETPSLIEIWIAVLSIIQAHRILGPFKSIDNVLDNIVRLVNTVDWSQSSELHNQIITAIDLAVENRWLYLVKAKTCQDKQSAREALDALSRKLVNECPSSKRAAEILLLRDEDADGELDPELKSLCLSILSNVAPTSAYLHINRGLEQFAAGAYAEATTSLLQGVASVPEHIAARVTLAKLSLLPEAFNPARCLDMVHASQDAVQLRFDALGTSARSYSDTDMNMLQARALTAQNKWADAIMVYEGIVEHEPFHVDAVIEVTEAHLHLGDVSAASTSIHFLPPQETAAYHSVLGWLKYHEGDLAAAKESLESAQTCSGVTWTLKYRLGRVYWDLDGGFRTNKAYCVAQWLGAAKLNPNAADVFNRLGTWYRTIAQDNVRAEKCFLKALSLDPSCENAGVTLTEMYTALHEDARLVRLWSDHANHETIHAPWAIVRLAQHQVANSNEAAIGNLHKLLRQDPSNGSYWAALGHVYQVFGRVVAAQKSYLKSLDLVPNSPGVLTELARIELSLGLYDEALGHLSVISSPTIASQKLLAETLFAQAKTLAGQGLYGQSFSKLQSASDAITEASNLFPPHSSLLKLQGDIHLFAFYLTPNDNTWLDFVTQGANAYQKALENDPVDAAAAEYDVGVGHWFLAQAQGYLKGLPMSKWSLEHDAQYPGDISKEIEKAQAHFAKSIRLNSSDAKAWNAIGLTERHVARKQFAFVRAIELENLDAAWANLGMLYLQCGVTAMAQKAFLSLQGVNPNHPAMWLGYGLMELRNNDAAQAHAAFSCALELRLDLDILQNFAYSALVSRTGSLDQVVFALKKLIERDAEDPAAYNSLGVALLRTELFNEAANAFKNAIRVGEKHNLAPESLAGVRANLARAYLLSGQPSTAEALVPQVAPTSQNLLQALTHLNQNRADDALKGLSYHADGNLHVELAKGVLQHRLGQANVARQMFMRLVEQYPQEKDEVVSTMIQLSGVEWWQPQEDELSPTLCRHLAAHYIKVRAEKDCQQVCEVWTSKWPKDPRGWLALAEFHLQFGRLAEGRVSIEKAPFVAPYEDHVKRLQMQAMVELMDSWQSGDFACRKLLHLHPVDPLAPFIIVMSLLKRHVKDPSGPHKDHASQLLNQVKPTSKFAEWLWHSLWLRLLPKESAEVRTHASSALQAIESLEVASTTKRLLRARTLALTDVDAAIEDYLQFLREEVSPSRAVVVELALLLETRGLNKTAWRLWRYVENENDDVNWKTLVYIKRSYLQRDNPKIAAKFVKEVDTYNVSPDFLAAFKEEFNVA